MMYLVFNANNDPVRGSSDFNGDLSKWDVSRVTNMDGMFHSMSSFDCDISRWDVSRVTTMEAMFAYALSFNRDLSKWDVSRVTNMDFMFFGASSFTQTLCGAWKDSSASNDYMFDRPSDDRICTFHRFDGPSTTRANSKTTSIKTLGLHSDSL